MSDHWDGNARRHARRPHARGTRRTMAAVGTVLVAALVIAGCSSGSAGERSPGVSSSSSAAPGTSATSSASGAAETSPTAVSSGRPSSSAGAGVALPSTPAGQQAAWFVAATGRLPITPTQATQHFDTTFLANVPVTELNGLLSQSGPARVTSIVSSAATAIVFDVMAGHQSFTVSLGVDSSGKIGALRLAPATAVSGTATAVSGTATAPGVPTSWAAVDAQVQKAVPVARMLVARLDNGSCQTAHAVDATTLAPTGSAFKLFVLDALATAVADGKISWTQQLTVTNAVKSLPSGSLQNAAAGTKVTVQQAAALMISISDNTAADMLIGLVGKPAVEQAMRSIGIADPERNIPFLTTKELFALKLSNYPVLAQQYLKLDQAGRTAFLASTVDKISMSSLNLKPWTTPRDQDTLEWFASPTDICRTYAALVNLAKNPKLAPIRMILSANNGGLNLPPATWPTEWFKGGSEIGVLTLNYLVTDKSGRTWVVSLMTENPNAPIPDSTTPTLLAAIAGAVQVVSGEA